MRRRSGDGDRLQGETVTASKPRRFIVHIGPMKTASTYLQLCLKAARADLLEAGIYYPEEFIAQNNKFMHMPLHNALMRKRKRELENGFAAIAAHGAHTVVLSCEHMMFLRRDSFEVLREVVGDAQLDVVYFARRWCDRYGSIWNQTLLMGGAQSFPEFYMAMLTGRPPNFYPPKVRMTGEQLDFDYSLIWRMLAHAVGRDSLSIFPYSTVMDRDEDVFEAFCRTVLQLDQAPEVSFAGEKKWASMPTEEAEILRVLNDMHHRRTGEEDAAIRNAFLRQRRHVDMSRITDAMEADMGEMEVDDRAAHFDAPYERMADFNDRVVGGGEVFARKAKQIRYVRPGYLLIDGVREELQGLYGLVARHVAENREPEEDAA